MNQNSITTRISDQVNTYYQDNYKNRFQGARIALECFPSLREESKLSLKGIFEQDELAFLVFCHQGQKIDGKELASRRMFEGYLADYWQQNKGLFPTLDFPTLIKKIRELGCFERFVLRELAYGLWTNPNVNEKDLEELA
jgi:hypothetical protein|tara:strand:- start:14446 stop:14865 length:420 start_codon:yes stop_codon:yes gene_type:complete